MIRILTCILMLASLLGCIPVEAKRKHVEDWYVNKYCKGVKEYRIFGGRIDCITYDYVIEFDFADKWQEAIGQSLFYSSMIPDRKAKIFLILESRKDTRFVLRLKQTIEYHKLPIEIELIKAY